jgi:glycosyltransferase involved in cell wall biosynthesis
MLQTSPRIRVALDAHVVGRRMTGNETYVVNLADALAARPDVDLVTYLDAEQTWPHEPPPGTVRHLRLRAPQLRIPLELPFRARRDGADLLHVQYVAPITRLPVVTAVHDVSFEDLPDVFSSVTTMRLKVSIRASVRMSGAVLALSGFTRDRILYHYGIRPEKVIVAPAGVSGRWRRIDESIVDDRLAPLRLPPRFVLAVGNLHPRKNIPRLVRSVARLRSAGADDIGLVVAGQPSWHSDDVVDAIRQVAGEDWVTLTGYVADEVLEALYNRAHIVAYPSLYEGFGLPVAEALAIGAVVVASDSTSIPEVAGDAALLVDSTDDEALSQGLIRAATDDALRARLKAAGPERAASLTWDACAAASIEGYRVALGG